MNEYKDQIAIVTGASSGIGKAIAQEMAMMGVKLGLVGRRVELLKAAMAQISINHSRYHCYQADLNSDTDIENLIRSIKKDYKFVDILVHSAGVISLGGFGSARIEEFDYHFRVNVRAPFLLTHHLLPLIKTRKGQILFINSSAGVMRARAKNSQYSLTKHALRAMADSLRDEVNQEGVRVLSVYPGKTATPMQEMLHKLEDREYNPELLLQPEDIAKVVINALKLPRTAEITDINIRPHIKTD